MPRRSRGRGGSGGLSRRAALGLIGGGGILAASASGAFDGVTGGRRFNIPVRSDDEANLGIDILDPADQTGSTVTLLELVNRYDYSFDTVTVTTDHDGQIDVDIRDPMGGRNSFDPPQRIPVDADISCGSGATESIEVDISVQGEDGSVSATRTVDVTCQVAIDPICEIDTPFVRGGGDGIQGQPQQGSQPPADIGTETGAVDVMRTSDNHLEVDIEMDPDDGKLLGDVHIDVQTSPDDFPEGLGNYHISEEFSDGRTLYSASIDLEDELGISDTTGIVIAVHSGLHEDSDSAWAKGPFQGTGWQMYLDSCEEGEEPPGDDPEMSVEIVSTNSPLQDGETLVAEVEVTEVGGASGSDTISMSVSPETGPGSEPENPVDTASIDLDAGAADTITLEWDTGGYGGPGGGAATYTVTVDSTTDTADTSIEIE